MQALRSPERLTVLYDERCALCRRASDWLLTQQCLVELELLPAGSGEARERYGSLPSVGSELVVVDERGNAWIGPSAFLACLWATARYRSWSFRLAQPGWAPYAAAFFRWVSKTRGRWGATCDTCGPGGAPGAAGLTCPRGHPLVPTSRFCTRCGAPAPGSGRA